MNSDVAVLKGLLALQLGKELDFFLKPEMDKPVYFVQVGSLPGPQPGGTWLIETVCFGSLLLNITSQF